uniref:Uncharacterized protein n=1 Tax=Corvus moneduloides TaxID=1196302 RepID=A0A8C3GZ57_CORMO
MKPPLLQIEAPTILCSMIYILVIASGTLPEAGCLLNSAVPLITTAKMLECGKGAEWEKSCILSIAVECFSEACHQYQNVKNIFKTLSGKMVSGHKKCHHPDQVLGPALGSQQPHAALQAGDRMAGKWPRGKGPGGTD